MIARYYKITSQEQSSAEVPGSWDLAQAFLEPEDDEVLWLYESLGQNGPDVSSSFPNGMRPASKLD